MLEIMRILSRAYNRSFVFFAVTSVTRTAQQVVFQGKSTFRKHRLFYIQDFKQKRHVVLMKTTRCFGENDTLFWRKRRVVLMKTTRCFGENDTLFW